MKKIFSTIIVMVMILFTLVSGVAKAMSDINMTVSPMRESVILNPGDVYKSAITVSNPGYSEQDLYYHVEVKPFYVDENYNPVFERIDGVDKQLLNEWVKITANETGTVAPNESKIVEYEITVPDSAPAGGQYACLSVITDVKPSEEGSINIAEGLAINHVILAEVTGRTIESGEILDAGVANMRIGDKVMAYSEVKNTGNVHGLAKYILTVKSPFTGEVIYTNNGEEDRYVLPDRELYNETTWNETPMVGIFNVDYTVEFQGMTSDIHRLVVVCPWWLIFMVILGIILLVLRVVSLVKLQKATKVLAESKNEQKT